MPALPWTAGSATRGCERATLGGVKVASYQAPLLPFGSMAAIELIEKQIAACERESVELLCCPEAIIGGLAHGAQDPGEVSLRVDNGELARTLASLMQSAVTVVVGFTERDAAGSLYNSAALLTGGALAAVYRKVYPGYRTVLQPGAELPLFWHKDTPFGIVICNDTWYIEPARVVAAAGAALLLVPVNGAHAQVRADAIRARGNNLLIARAVENQLTVIAADVGGRDGDLVSYGTTAIIDPDGTVLARAEPLCEDLLIADVAPQRPPSDPRGWDGYTNPAVSEVFVRLSRPPIDLLGTGH